MSADAFAHTSGSLRAVCGRVWQHQHRCPGSTRCRRRLSVCVVRLEGPLRSPLSSLEVLCHRDARDKRVKRGKVPGPQRLSPTAVCTTAFSRTSLSVQEAALHGPTTPARSRSPIPDAPAADIVGKSQRSREAPGKPWPISLASVAVVAFTASGVPDAAVTGLASHAYESSRQAGRVTHLQAVLLAFTVRPEVLRC